MTPYIKYKLTRIGLRWKDKYLASACNHKLCLILGELYTRKMEYRRCWSGKANSKTSRTIVCSHCNAMDGLKLFNKHNENENLQGNTRVPEIH